MTASPTAGFDPEELIDTRALARQMHHYILNRREMYGLPRKFNIAFDGGGSISTLEDTNDIGFVAVRANGNSCAGNGAQQATAAGIARIKPQPPPATKSFSVCNWAGSPGTRISPAIAAFFLRRMNAFPRRRQSFASFWKMGIAPTAKKPG